MRSMPNIVIDYRNLNKLFMGYRMSGGEAIICQGFRPNTLLKIFADSDCQKYCDSFGTPFRLDLVEMSDNKFQKIKRLYDLDLEGCVKPLSTISVDGRLIGYEMSYDQDDQTLLNQTLSFEDLIAVLKDSRGILEELAEKDITFGDVNACNLLVNKKTRVAKFCDIDNMRVGKLSFDLIDRNFGSYLSGGGKEEWLDAYMHNVMTLSMLLNAPLATLYLRPEEIASGDYSEYLEKGAEATLASMQSPATFNGEYVIQYVKKIK